MKATKRKLADLETPNDHRLMLVRPNQDVPETMSVPDAIGLREKAKEQWEAVKAKEENLTKYIVKLTDIIQADEDGWLERLGMKRNGDRRKDFNLEKNLKISVRRA